MTHTYSIGHRTLGARLLGLAAVSATAVLAVLILAAPAPAAKLGGKTTLAPNTETLDALGAAGISVAPSGQAKAGGKGISFPIVSGKVNVEDVQGKIKHKGGLTFSDSATSVTLQGYVIKLGKKNVIRAKIAGGGGKVRLADLDLDKAKIKERGSTVVISKVGVTLANRAAKALSGVFGIPNLAGADLGVATVKVKP